MPVITRSIYRINQQKHNIEETPERVSCGNGKYRKVLITPCEPSSTENLPAINKKPKLSVIKPTGEVCRQLKFEDIMPEKYRGFDIKNKSMRVKVDDFYEMCDIHLKEKAKEGSTKRSEIKDNIYQLDSFTNDYLISVAKSLLNQDLFTNFDKQVPCENINLLIENWGNTLTTIYSVCFMRMFDKSKNANWIDNLNIIAGEIVPLVILFQPIISQDRFKGFGRCKRLLGAIILKLIEFCNKGVVQAVVAINKYFPDMVSIDCYPSLNPEVYIDTIKITESLLEKSSNLLEKTEWNCLKKIYNIV
jgi:hypothetical protein